ncbi:MAG TPA: multidrug ABC transporter ATP-binding protein [Flavobacteriales bacterium]|nr:multidrug ABC transporter ATP-binding protein [Flavobacteriales bacterium]|tara:strand:+ start:5902 stop:7722 length:1821 start_codon:yes stop_codon:yes gene_type:complete
MAGFGRKKKSNENDDESFKKVKINKDNLRKALRVFQFIKPYRLTFGIGLFILLLSSMATMIFPWLVGDLVDARAEKINNIALALFVLFFLNAIFSFLRIYLFERVTQKALAAIRKETFKKLLTSPMAFFSSRRTGELSSRIANDVSLLQQTFTVTIAEFLRQIITVSVGVTALLILSPRLTLFMLSIIPVVALIAVLFGKFIKKLSKEAQNYIADSNTIVEEVLNGIVNVKAFANEAYELFRYGKKMDDVIKVSLKAAFWRGIFVSFIIFCVFGAIISIIWYGVKMVNAHEINPQEGITMGELLKFILYSVFIGVSFGGIADLYSQLQKAIGASEKLMDILEQPSENVHLEKIQIKNRIQGDIAFDNVHFAYPSRRDIEVLKGVTFSANKGDQIAIVGPSGAGKSTITQLIYRFYENYTGTISVDGKDIKSFDLTEYRSQLAIVPQEVMLFGGSIKENIAYGKPGATDEEIFEAAKKANALEFIESFPEKFDTIVGDRGVQLSGGQRQRVAIARAILKDPKILILDEATSALDSESEKLVQQALDVLMKDRTSIVIAHRLSTIKNAKNILVLDNGKVIEQGTHDELIQKENGVYKKLSELQFSTLG